MGELVSIVIPTYNESQNVPVLLRSIDSVMRNAKMKYECIVIDDNSPDNTYEIAKKLSKKYPVKAFLRRNQRGLSSAMLYGFKQAKGSIVGWIDSDLQHEPKLIPDLVKAISDEGCLMSVGSRLVKGGNVVGWALHRRIISWGARMLVAPLTKVKDTMSGFLFIRPEIVRGIKLNAIGYKLGLEIMVKGRHNNKFREVPYVFKNRLLGGSKMTWKTNLEFACQAAMLYAYKARQLLK